MVIWAIVMVAWAWWGSALAAFVGSDSDGALETAVIFAVALGPAALAVWKYPTGRLFRAAFAVAAFSVPLFSVASIILT